MQDVELIAQAGALLSHSAARDVPAGLQGGVDCGWLDRDSAEVLEDCYQLCWSVQAAARLISAKPLDSADMGEGTAAFLCRTTGHDSIDNLEDTLGQCYDRADRLISAALDREDAP